MINPTWLNAFSQLTKSESYELIQFDLPFGKLSFFGCLPSDESILSSIMYRNELVIGGGQWTRAKGSEAGGKKDNTNNSIGPNFVQFVYLFS